ncbi:MAG: caspase family protein, partial [Bacteroidetes bacterium]|nr:caspase family protein [Bacteroidota bacterium]
MKQFYLLCIVSFLFLSSVESYAQVKDPDGSETVTPRGVRPVGMQSESGSVRAVIIGISDYKEIDDLKYAARDAEIFYDYLVSNAGGNIDSARIDLLTNEQANFGNIWKSFERLKAESVAGDKVIIYFSGHGDVETLTDAQNGYLLTYNTNKNVYPLGGFPLSMLSHYLITLSNMDVQVIFIGDACRSGKLAGGMDGAMQTNALLKMQWANEIKILSCQPGELSMESATCGGGRGIFSYHLVQGLYGLADENGDGDVTLAELQIYLLKKVPPASPFPQNPVVTGNFITSLARVDTQSLLALREKQSVYENYIASLEPRGQIGGFLEELEPEKKRIYLHFRKFIEEGNLITPAHACALEAFTRMTKMDVNESIIKMMQRNLAAALQNEAQDVISNYVNSIIPV